MSMLAAYTLSSNVTPDNLQSPPVGGASGIATKQLAVPAATTIPQTNPAGFSQQHAARFKARGVPLSVGFQQLDGPTGQKAQSPARPPRTPQLTQFPSCHGRPQATACQPQPRGNGQTQDNQASRQGERHSGPENDSAQKWLRCDLGEVCG
jgi:hypothetical protein